MTKPFRVSLFKNITKRFGSLMYDDMLRQATFLDPVFGPTCFDSYNRNQVIGSIKNFISKSAERLRPALKQQQKHNQADFVGKMKRFSLEETTTDYDEISDYIRFSTETGVKCPLKFWKENHSRWPNLSKLAMKVLGVPATSASVERMFSITGHIFQSKRRRMTDKLFSTLVYSKLNEHLL